MEKELKKNIFLLILNYLFNDDTMEIDEDNCISFYHFLVSTLEDEIMSIPAEDEADISLCHSIIEMLCNFDLMNEDISDWSAKSIKNYLIDFSGLTEEEYQKSISTFRKIYILIKDDFILGLT